MESYVDDILIKQCCCSCNSEFILSKYQAGNAHQTIVCPYCHGEDIKSTIEYDPEDRTIDVPSCIGMGHHVDIEKQKESYAYTWGRIIQLKIDKLTKEINELSKYKNIYE